MFVPRVVPGLVLGVMSLGFKYEIKDGLPLVTQVLFVRVRALACIFLGWNRTL